MLLTAKRRAGRRIIVFLVQRGPDTETDLLLAPKCAGVVALAQRSGHRMKLF